MLATSRSGGTNAVSLRVSETSLLAVQGRGLKRKPVRVAPHRTVNLHFSGSLHTARLSLRDRAGNVRVWHLHWG